MNRLEKEPLTLPEINFSSEIKYLLEGLTNSKKENLSIENGSKETTQNAIQGHSEMEHLRNVK